MKILFEMILNFLKILYVLRYYLFLILCIYFFRYLPFIIKYYKSSYKEVSGMGIFKFLFNTGYLGEGLTYIELENIPQYSKILVNIYIPTEDGTTEIDLVYITASGIYVIESKNYSGWIYGSYKNKEWTQNIYGRKYKFYNPIWQNKTHIKYLSKVIPENELKSLIVFSERSTLKKVVAHDGLVIKRGNIKERILKDNNEKILTDTEINNLYEKLKVYGNKDNKEKKEHIDRLKNKKNI